MASAATSAPSIIWKKASPAPMPPPLCGGCTARRNAPAYRFSGATARWVADHGLTAHLSLSHDGGMALAFCILETAPET